MLEGLLRAQRMFGQRVVHVVKEERRGHVTEVEIGQCRSSGSFL